MSVEGKNPFDVVQEDQEIELSFGDFTNPPEHETEHETEEIQEEEEEVEDEDENIQEEYEDEDEEETGASIILKEYVDKGLINAEVKKDLTGEELMDIVYNNLYDKAKKDLEEQGYNEDVRKGIEFLKAGGSIEDLQQLYKSVSYSELDISDDYELSNRETLIKAYHKEKGLTDKKIEQLYQLSVTNDETYEDALEAQEYFKNKDKEMIEAQEAERVAREQEFIQEQERNKELVDSLLKKGSLGGLKVTKYEADKIKKALYEDTETVTINDNGKNKVIKTNKYNVLLQEYQNNPEWQLLFVKFLLDGFKFDSISKDIKNQRDNEIIDTFNHKLNKKAIKKPKNVEDYGTNSNSKYVTELNI